MRNIGFCWIVFWTVPQALSCSAYRFHAFSLVCTPAAFEERLATDIKAGRCPYDIIPRSLKRLDRYAAMDTVKIDTSSLSGAQVAEILVQYLRK